MENQINQIKPFSAITPEIIQDWKARHGADALSQSTIRLPKEESNSGDKEGSEGEIAARFILKKPTRWIMDAVASSGLKKDVIASNKVLIANCVLGGDMDLLEQDGGIYSALLRDINKQITFYEGDLKKL